MILRSALVRRQRPSSPDSTYMGTCCTCTPMAASSNLQPDPLHPKSAYPHCPSRPPSLEPLPLGSEQTNIMCCCLMALFGQFYFERTDQGPGVAFAQFLPSSPAAANWLVPTRIIWAVCYFLRLLGRDLFLVLCLWWNECCVIQDTGHVICLSTFSYTVYQCFWHIVYRKARKFHYTVKLENFTIP